MPLPDAHAHLQFAELQEIDLQSYFQAGHQVAVNGTHPGDWGVVAELARTYAGRVIPQFGVHPWEVRDLPSGWEATLRHYLQEFPCAGVGEVGLDKWVRGANVPLQLSILRPQLAIAQQLQRPVTLHCLRAWGTLRDLLRQERLTVPFLLHAYAGPAEWVEEFAEMGAYFSFSPYFLHERKRAAAVERFARVPASRLLIETDAPAMLGPAETWGAEQEPWSQTHQHPSNLACIYAATAQALNRDLTTLTSHCTANFQALFRGAE